MSWGTLNTAETGRDDHESAMKSVGDLLEQLREWQARCTCLTQSVMLCPNYVTGDEEGVVRVKVGRNWVEQGVASSGDGHHVSRLPSGDGPDPEDEALEEEDSDPELTAFLAQWAQE